MPYNVIPAGQGKYSVVNTATGKVHAAKTSHENALRQMQLLYAIEKNPDFKPRKSDFRSKERTTEMEQEVADIKHRNADNKKALKRIFERRAGVKHSGWP
jgi:hypothetical protein